MTLHRKPHTRPHGKPYGLWPSPITPDSLAGAARLTDVAWSRDGQWLVWQEERDGQGTLCADRLDGDAPLQLTEGLSVRGRIGYGGGCLATGDDFVIFAAADGRLYRQPLEPGSAWAITPPGILCAMPTVSPDGAWVLYVFEVEGASGLAIVDAEGQTWPQRLVGGHDFHMQPTWSPDIVPPAEIAWIAWDHPHMPWDSTSLYSTRLHHTAGGWQCEPARLRAGRANESVLQPAYAPDGGRLAYISDAGGWYHPHVCAAVDSGVGDSSAPHQRLMADEAEYATPPWSMGMRYYGWLPDSNALAALRLEQGHGRLMRIPAIPRADPSIAAPDSSTAIAAGTLCEDPLYTEWSMPAVNPVDGRVAAIASGERIPPRIVVVPTGVGAVRPARGALAERGTRKVPVAPIVQVVQRSAPERIPPEHLVSLEPLQWPGGDGETVHGLLARPNPTSGHGAGHPPELPPLIVQVHGGPTSQTYRSWRPDVQFFAGRGYAVLEVNHRGSSGYGRAYRDALREQWGVLDVADVISGARHLVAQGIVDGNRIAIRGGSAGGYTVLRALTLHPEVFRAAICLYGICDLFALVQQTHKFEAHYLDTLIGPLPREAERYRERSPIFQAERITTPLLVCQGRDDAVVPPQQSERIVAALRAQGVPHEYLLFDGEGHGFRRQETLRTLWETTERFLATHLVYG